MNFLRKLQKAVEVSHERLLGYLMRVVRYYRLERIKTLLSKAKKKGYTVSDEASVLISHDFNEAVEKILDTSLKSTELSILKVIATAWLNMEDASGSEYDLDADKCTAVESTSEDKERMRQFLVHLSKGEWRELDDDLHDYPQSFGDFIFELGVFAEAYKGYIKSFFLTKEAQADALINLEHHGGILAEKVIDYYKKCIRQDLRRTVRNSSIKEVKNVIGL